MGSTIGLKAAGGKQKLRVAETVREKGISSCRKKRRVYFFRTAETRIV